MTALTSADKDKIKRVVPKSSNKIIDAAIVRLYVNYPSIEEWTWTGLTGAVVLVDDLIGHTFFFKLVDVIGNQGVLWDQELWVDFQYSQDRLFFHSFEIEDFSVGFLFEDKSEAQHFFKRVQNRHKHASKLTVQNNNAVEARKRPEQTSTRGYRGDESGADGGSNGGIFNEQRTRRLKGVLYYENEPPPEWRSFYKELENMGISEDMIAENREFIKDYIAKQGGPLVGLEPPIPRRYQNQVRDLGNSSSSGNGTLKASRSISQSLRSRSNTVNSGNSERKKKAPPPPPPPGSASSTDLGSTTASTPPPPPPYSNTNNDFLPQSRQDSYPDMEEIIEQEPATSAPSQSSSSPSEPRRVHNVPPPMTFPTQPQSPMQAPPAPSAPGLPPRMAPPTAARPVPSPPPRNGVPPAPPARGNVAMMPPPPPARGAVPPPPPARNPNAPAPPPSRRGPAPPPPPSRHANNSAAPPALPPGHPGYNPYGQQQQQQPQQQLPPQPYQQYQQQPPPQAQAPPQLPPQAQAGPPPPPPPPMPAFTNPPPPSNNSLAPPPPPPPPGFPAMADTAPPLVETTGNGDRDALLASIRGAGIGKLRKVDKSQLDKPSVLLQEARGEPVPPTASAAPAGAPGQPASLADALAAALSNRKAKVAASDDESDGDW